MGNIESTQKEKSLLPKRVAIHKRWMSSNTRAKTDKKQAESTVYALSVNL